MSRNSGISFEEEKWSRNFKLSMHALRVKFSSKKEEKKKKKKEKNPL